MYEKKDGSMTLNVRVCESLKQKEYKRRHEKVAQNLHWLLYSKYVYKVTSVWYQHNVMDEKSHIYFPLEETDKID